MIKNYAHILRFIYVSGDLFLLNIIFFISYFIRFKTTNLDFHYLSLLLYFNLIWLFISFLLDNYEVSRVDGYTRVTKMMLQSVILHFLSVTAVFVFIKADYFSRYFLGYHYLIFLTIIILWRRGMVYILRFFRKRGFNFKQFIVLGYSELGEKLMTYFAHNPEFGYKFRGIFDNEKKDSYWQGTLKEAESFIQEEEIHEVYCSNDALSNEHIKKLRYFADKHIVRVKILPDLKFLETANIHLENYGGIPVVLTRVEPLENIANQLVKRIFDVVFSLAVIIFVFSWLFPIIFILIKLDSEGPVFFIQKRRGKNFELFPCYKFRTMTVNNESDTKHVSKGDSRITKIGAFLRKTNLDEFPQFFNVLIGDMSIVGPRPNFLKHSEEYSKTMEKYMVRHLVRPGITGLAQVKGYRGVVDRIHDMKHRVMYDIFYIENWSFILDIKIVFLTVWNMLRGDKNAY